jgi:Ca-activated chloride channel family protein
VITARSTSGKAAFVALPAVLCALLAAPTAHGQEGADRADLAPTMLVLDASGSMTGADPAGGTKMEAAKRAVHALVDAAPDGAPVGLAAYGTSTGNSEAERTRGCQDVTVLQDPGPIDKAGLRAAVDGLTPRGYTPIGRSLQVAAQRLPQEGPRSVVLVSDGEDTCGPPEPCEVVRTLAGQGVDLVVHAVGFGVDDAAREQLSCVAQATGGTYTDAPDADALQRVLPRVTSTAMRNYAPAGTPITGAATPAAAPVAAPGQHLDTIGQEEKRYYAVDVPQGATAYFTATVSFPRLPGIDVLEDFNGLQLRTYGEAGEDCNEFEHAQTNNSSDGAALTVTTTWDGATEEDTGSASGDRCKGAGRYTFAVEWSRVSAGVPQRLPVELLVGVEPGVVDGGPVAVLPEAGFRDPASTPRPVTGGGSFTVAGTLDGTGAYTDALQRSELVFYRVRLDWGQGLAYRVRFAETPGRGLDNLSPVRTTLYTPTREEIDSDFASYTGTNQVLPANDPALTTVPVRYGNRDADVVAVRPQSLAGWYYIAVHLGSTHSGATAAPVPIQLDLSVTGTPEPGPRYAEEGATFGGGRPSVAEPDRAAPPDAVAAPDAAATTTAVAPAVWALAGAAIALVVVGAVLALRARRRKG